ncbi:MAG: hypothetical protein U0939_25890 [Pirellulales bacterium]
MYLLAADEITFSGICFALALVFAGWLLGLATNEFQHWIMLKFRGPELDITFDNAEDCQTLTPEFFDTPIGSSAVGTKQGQRLVFYARLRVQNKKTRIADRCQAYLVRVEERQGDGTFKSTIFNDSIPLIWSYDPDNATVSIPKGVVRHIDLVRIQSDKAMIEPQLRSHNGFVYSIERYKPIFEKHSTLRLTIRLSAEDIASEERQVTITWNGNWPPTAA